MKRLALFLDTYPVTVLDESEDSLVVAVGKHTVTFHANFDLTFNEQTLTGFESPEQTFAVLADLLTPGDFVWQGMDGDWTRFDERESEVDAMPEAPALQVGDPVEVPEIDGAPWGDSFVGSYRGTKNGKAVVTDLEGTPWEVDPWLLTLIPE